MTELWIAIGCVTLVSVVALIVLGRSLAKAADVNANLTVNLMWRLREAHDVIVTDAQQQIERQRIMAAFDQGANHQPSVYTTPASRLSDDETPMIRNSWLPRTERRRRVSSKPSMSGML